MTEEERRAKLEAIAAEVAVCTRCRLHQTRTRAVPGEGNPDTEVMFVGEGPGFNEDRQGRPFVGQAGALLTDLLASLGWRREDVFITNVVKCRPPGNRDPEPDEIGACSEFLARQLEALDPALVVTLGRFSMARFMPGARIGQVHGTYRPADAGSGAPESLAFAMYHPAAALHQGSLKETLFRDMAGVPTALLAARDRRAQAADPHAAQAPDAEPEAAGAEPEAPSAEQEAVDADAKVAGERLGEAETHVVETHVIEGDPDPYATGLSEGARNAVEADPPPTAQPEPEPELEPSSVAPPSEAAPPAPSAKAPESEREALEPEPADNGRSDEAELVELASENAGFEEDSRESRAQLTLF